MRGFAYSHVSVQRSSSARFSGTGTLHTEQGGSECRGNTHRSGLFFLRHPRSWRGTHISSGGGSFAKGYPNKPVSLEGHSSRARGGCQRRSPTRGGLRRFLQRAGAGQRRGVACKPHFFSPTPNSLLSPLTSLPACEQPRFQNFPPRLLREVSGTGRCAAPKASRGEALPNSQPTPQPPRGEHLLSCGARSCLQQDPGSASLRPAGGGRSSAASQPRRSAPPS